MRINPFLATFQIPVIRVVKDKKTEYSEQQLDEDYYDIETVSQARVYRGVDRDGKFHMLMNLSSTALKLYTWMQYYVADKSDTIRLDDKRLIDLFDISESRMNRVRSELIHAAIIAKKADNVYWINPRFFTAGNRVHMYPDNLLVTHIRKESGV